MCLSCYLQIRPRFSVQQEAEDLLETAVALEPNSGNYLANLGKLTSYIASYQFAIQFAESCRLILIAVGVVYHLLKDYGKAEEAYSLALKLQPDLTLAKENFNKLMSVNKTRSQL